MAFEQLAVQYLNTNQPKLAAEHSAKNPTFKKVYESLVPFRNDQYLWWQVAEYTFDNFMIRSRSKL